jgi:hypothetical protein
MKGEVQEKSPSPEGEGLRWGLSHLAAVEGSTYTSPTPNPSPEGEGP